MENKSKVIKLSDGLLMLSYETKIECVVNPLLKETKVTFLEYFEWLLTNNFANLKEFIMSSFEIKEFPEYDDDIIIENIISKKLAERAAKYNDTNYYICNALCAYNTIKEIFTQDLYDYLAKIKDNKNIMLSNYCRILKSFICDLSQLGALYDKEIKKMPKNKIFVFRPIHSIDLHKLLGQSIYGLTSLHSFADFEISSSIAIIRQIIELRIRRAIGIISYIDEKGDIKPLNFSEILKELKKYNSQDIQFPVKFSCIENIYKWSNFYIHSGQGDFAWIPFFIERYLKAFSLGTIQNNGTYSCKNAIKITKKTLDEVYNNLAKNNYEFYRCEPECIIVD